jgi:Holliday junction resolvasome RuvABC endonuclease subunit
VITLGLDPSLTGFGWCVHRSTVAGPRRVVAKGVWKTSAKRVFVWRYMVMRELVGQLLDAHPEVFGVGIESPPFGELWSEGLYGLFLYVVEAVFVRRKDVVFFDPLTVKLLAKMDPKVRRGTMDKQDMIEASKADTQIKRWNHNEADAFIVARSAARFWDLHKERITQDELTPSERHSFTRVRKVNKGWQAGRTIGEGLVFREDDRFFQFSLLDPSDVSVAVTFDREVPK